MPRRRTLRAGSALLAGLALALLTPAAALADGPPAPSPTPSASASPAPTVDPAAVAEAQRLAARIVALQQEADAAGERAQKAAERAHSAHADAASATQALRDADTVANAAAERARASRARASAVAARLARTDLGTLPLSLMLNARTAEGVLGGLSTTGQLSVQSQRLYRQAQDDAAEAHRLQGLAAAQAHTAAVASAAADDADRAARRVSARAEQAVTDALAQQSALVARLRQDGADVCGAVGDAPVETCIPAGVAPAGDSIGAAVVAYALRQLGKPYVFAADGPEAFDCSGLTLAAYRSAGVSIGIHSATAQYRLAAAQGDLVPVGSAAPGDLLFYTDGGGDMYHVTIAAGDGLMIEAPYPGAQVREVPVRTGDLAPLAAHFG